MNTAIKNIKGDVLGSIARGMILGLLLSLSLFVLYAIYSQDIADFRYIHF